MATTVLPATHAHGLGGATWRQRVRAVWIWLHEAICGLHGHDLLMRYERQRICLECSTCGYQTAGWHLGRSDRRARREK